MCWESTAYVLRDERCSSTTQGESINNAKINSFGRGLVMASLIINSLLAHIERLRVFMSNSKIDLLSINETKLDRTIDDSELYLPGYELIGKDRVRNGRNGGGVCFYVRCNLNYKIREDLSSENLDLLVLEITRLRSRSFLVSTWYRPPDSPTSVFNDFEKVVMRMDAENWEFFLLGDTNVDLTPGITSANAIKLQHILDIYGLDQLITEPTRVTMNSCTLIYYCITNSPDKIAKSGAVHLAMGPLQLSDQVVQNRQTGEQMTHRAMLNKENSNLVVLFDMSQCLICSPVWRFCTTCSLSCKGPISDHALIYMTHKAKYDHSGARIIKPRHMKNFHKSGYLRDLQTKAWSDIETLNDPNDMWSMWKDMLMQSIDKRAPLKPKRVGNKMA